MQTTLLGIAIALILALVAALVGPFFVNWNAHRAFFETEATRLVGLPVYVTGAIDVSVLPTPSITLRGIAIGEKGDASRLRAGALALELGLGPLMRGELRAAEMRLIAPEFKIGLDRTGALDLPNLAIGIQGERVSIDHLSIEEGRAILTDATTGYRAVIDKFWFRGEVRSLIGPFRGEGGFLGADSFYKYRVSASRFGSDGIKLKLSVDGLDRSLTIESDGALSFDYGAPRFDGNLTVVRPVGTVLASGKAAVNEPWRATTRIKASPTGVTFDQVEFQYGPEERAMKFTGTGEAKLGEQPRLDGVFSARQLDFDRLVAKPDGARRPPFAALKALAELFGDSLTPSLPTRLFVSIDTATLGGATLQAIGADMSSQGDFWNLDKLDFRAPGFTQVRASGRVELTPKGLGYSGLATVTATDSAALFAWLTGQNNQAPGTRKPWHAHGSLTLSSDRIAVERLRAEFDRASVDGNFAYEAGNKDRAASLKAELNATELDVDGWLEGTNSIFTGFGLERPGEVDLALEIVKAQIAGFEARKVSVKLKLDKEILDLKNLSIEGFGDATLVASGRIDTQGASPRGSIKLDLDARDMSGLVASAEKFAPGAADPLRRLGGRQAVTKLNAAINVDTSGSVTKRTTARIALDGQIGAFRLKIAGGTTIESALLSLADMSSLAAGDLRFEGQFDADDGSDLLAVLGLDRILVTDKKAGRLKVSVAGPTRDLRIDGRLTAGPIDITASGVANSSGAQPASANLNRVFGTVGGSKIQGKLIVGLGPPLRIDGVIEADRLDAPAAFASVVGMSVDQIKPREGGRETWSREPFKPTTSTLSGRIEIKAARAQLTPKLVANATRGVLQFGASKVSFELLQSELAGGKFTGEVAFSSRAEGLSTLSYIELTGANAALVVPTAGQSPIMGKLSLQTTIEGLGLTPAAFLGSLSGQGAVTIEGGEFAGLNPNVFEALTQAVDLGIQTDPKQIKEFVGIVLDKGYLTVPRAQSNLAIVGGQLRLVGPQVEAKGAALAVAGSIDLADATYDATLTLSGAPAGDVAGRPAVTLTIKGGLAAPKSTINAESLAGWLALRSVEKQSKRLQTIEAARRAALAQPPLDQLAPGLGPTGQAVRTNDEDETNGKTPNPTNSGRVAPAESTSGILGSNQIPPLLPPIVIQPGAKSLDRSGAPLR